MNEINIDAISTDEVNLPGWKAKNIQLSVLRLDKIHPLISGNKWFKLRFYLDDAKKLNKKTIVTYGGAWSNHILATAAAAKKNDLQSIGIIRGERPAVFSSTLLQSQESGMKLIFISRDKYKENFIPNEIEDENNYIIAEGGMGEKGVDGASTILDHCRREEFTHICCAIGTGTMMSGLINAALPSNHVIGISVLKNNPGTEKVIQSFIRNNQSAYNIIHDYHFGGYAKYNSGLLDFMNSYYSQTNIPTDFVYTGKLFYALHDMVSNDYFPEGSKLLAIHSGGIQGNNSLKKGTLIF